MKPSTTISTFVLILVIICMSDAFSVHDQKHDKLPRALLKSMEENKKKSDVTSVSQDIAPQDTEPQVPKIKYYFPDREALDLCKRYVDGLIEVDIPKIASTIVNDTDAAVKTFRLTNLHYKMDWNGSLIRAPNGRLQYGGFELSGFQQVLQQGAVIRSLLEHQCSLSRQNIYIESYLVDNRALPVFGKYKKMCKWRGYIGGIVREEFNFPGFEKITAENGFYTMPMEKDAYTGKILIGSVTALDLEVPIPQEYWADLYAEKDWDKRCKKFNTLLEPKKVLFDELQELLSHDQILDKPDNN
jgi:hypothetical protein